MSGAGRGDLLAEELEGFLTRAADLFVHARRPGLHLLVHPVTAALAVDDADAFADRVEDQIGLLGDERAFSGRKSAESEKIALKWSLRRASIA